MKEDRLDLLLHALFEESPGEAELEELNELLSSDPAARIANKPRPAASRTAAAAAAAATRGLRKVPLLRTAGVPKNDGPAAFLANAEWTAAARR